MHDGMKCRRTKIRLAVYMILTLGLLFVALFGENISPYDPYKTNVMAIDQPPSYEYWFGTDNLGRCLFSRVLTGARSSLSATLLIVAMTGILGTLIGVAAGYYGGTVDNILKRLLLIFQSFPGQVLAIAIVGVLGAGFGNAVIALGAIGWIAYARIARSMVLKIRNAGYVNAARLCGCGSAYIIIHHVIPNISPLLLVTAMNALAGTMLEISALSFLGLSATPPIPEWGFMISEGRKVLMTAPWQTLFPGIAILITVIILNRLGDSVQDYMAVRQQELSVI